MIEHQLVLIIALILAICLLIMVSQRVKVAYSLCFCHLYCTKRRITTRGKNCGDGAG